MDSTDHPLTLNAVRLCRPMVDLKCIDSVVIPPPAEATASAAVSQAGAHIDDLPGQLVLPDGVGDVYLGQEFTALLCLINHGAMPIPSVSISTELQEGGKRIPLVDRGYKGASKDDSHEATDLHPGSRMEVVVSRRVLEAGTHILRVNVTYASPTFGESKTFRRYFHFEVLNALKCNFTCVSLEERILVQCALSNLSSNTMTIQGLEFHAGQPFRAAQIADSDAPRSTRAAAGPLDVALNVAQQMLATTTAIMAPGDVKQHVFSLDWPAEARQRALMTAELGVLTVHWNGLMGEPSVWQSGAVIRKLPTRGAVDVVFKDVPATWTLGVPITITCEVRNLTAIPLALQLCCDSETLRAIEVQGLSSMPLGSVAAGASASCTVELVALLPGQQEIKGFCVKDMTTDRPLAAVNGDIVRSVFVNEA